MALTDEQRDILDKLYRQMEKRMFTRAMKSVKNRELALEAVQETFAIACGKGDGFFAHDNPEGWLMLTLKNILQTELRERAKATTLFYELVSRVQSAPYHSLSETELDIIGTDALGQEFYPVFKYVHLKKMTKREAADILGIDMDACYKRLQRARKELKKILEK